MQVVSYIKSAEELSSFVDAGVSELIVAPKEFSRFGHLSIEQALALSERIKESGIRTVLEWDILMTQDVFEEKSKAVLPLLSSFDAVRVYDVGALNFVIENSETNVQLVLEIGNHNLKSIDGWIKLCGDRIDRLVLSLELDSSMLKEYAAKLDVPLEFYGLGRMPLSYTPRKLVSPIFGDKGESFEVIASSEESPHRDFPVLQNSHGTFAFYMKDHGPIEHFGELKSFGIDYLRVDLRHLPDLSLLSDVVKLAGEFSDELCSSIKERYPRQLFKGFYNKNKSDSVFKKLKNERLSRVEDGYLGEVIDVAKKRYMGILIRSDIEVRPGMDLIFKTPEGKTKELSLKAIFDSKYDPIESASKGRLFYLPHLGGISTRTAVFIK